MKIFRSLWESGQLVAVMIVGVLDAKLLLIKTISSVEFISGHLKLINCIIKIFYCWLQNILLSLEAKWFSFDLQNHKRTRQLSRQSAQYCGQTKKWTLPSRMICNIFKKWSTLSSWGGYIRYETLLYYTIHYYYRHIISIHLLNLFEVDAGMNVFVWVHISTAI